MKEKLITMLGVAAALCIVALTGASCSSDNDNEETSVSTAEAMYAVQVSQDLLGIATVTAHYYDQNGKEQTEAVSNTKWTKKWTTTKFPATLRVWTEVTPKGNATTESYQLQCVAGALVIYTPATGNKWTDGCATGSLKAQPETVTADNVATWCAVKRSVECEVTANGQFKDNGGNEGGDMKSDNSFCRWIVEFFGMDPKICD